MTDARLRTVLVGFGRVADTIGGDARMARYFPHASHAAVLASHPAFAWDAVVDPDAGARARAQADWGIAVTAPSLAALPDADRYGCAVLAVPPQARAGILERLPGLRAVMVEKPLATGIDAAEAFARESVRRGIAVQVAYWRRGVASIRDLAAGVLAREIGTVQAGFGVYGNGIANNGSHLIDLIRLLVGEIEAVTAIGADRPAGPIPGDVDVAAVLGLAGGAHVFLAPLDFDHYREVGLDLWGTCGRIALMQESLVALRYPRTEHRALEDVKELACDRPEMDAVIVAEAHRSLYDNLAAATRGEAALWSGIDSALATERVVHRIAQVAR